MLQYKKGDILAEDTEALINTVNCVGVMGRGIALQFKNAFPENFEEYARACKRDEVQQGRMFVTEINQLTTPRYIINFPTKRHWRGKSRIEDIDAGLADLQRVIREMDIRSIAIPPLGCGLGGEPSGHVILSDYGMTGDGVITALQILAAVVEGGRPVSDVCSLLTPCPQVQRSLPAPDGFALEDARFREVVEGVKARLGAEGRVLVRRSGTEPVIRVMAEGAEPDRLQMFVDEICVAIGDAS